VTTPDCEPQAVRRQLDQTLASANFSRNERLSRFLRFVVERHLEGRDHELKESVIALEVFGHHDYDPKQDSIVRTEAGRLRARLAEYYVGPGTGDPVIFELPKGGYVPVIRRLPDAPVQKMEPPGPKQIPRRRPWLLPVIAGSVVALGVVAWLLVPGKTKPITIAVLPLQNLNQDPATDYFADGLTDEIIRNLSIVDGLAARSRTSSFTFKGRPRNLHDVGKQLEADYILEGSVLRSGRQLRINVQLVRVRDDVTLWPGKYDRELTDVFAIQEEISHGIVDGLRLKLARGRRRYETSVEAYDLYLRAHAVEMENLMPLSGTERAIGFYQDAIGKDPTFAPAYAGVALAYAFRSGTVQDDRQDDLTKMRAAAEKAIQLDPLSGEAHMALGVSRARDGKWKPAEESFRQAIALEPTNSMAHSHFAMYLLLPLGQIEEALDQLRIAEKADPLSPQVHGLLGYVLTSARRYSEAAGHCRKASNVPGCLGRTLLGQGSVDEAIQMLGTSVSENDRAFLGHALARAGRREEAEKLLPAFASRPAQEALIYSGLGDKDRTFDALNRLTAQGPMQVGRYLTFPEFALIRGDPRLTALRKKVGLPE
jgi:TolB-like protein/Tfp pilus assembly protein PilF